MAHANHNVVLVLDYGERRRSGCCDRRMCTAQQCGALGAKQFAISSQQPARLDRRLVQPCAAPSNCMQSSLTAMLCISLAGSQYTQLIARRIREIGMLSILFPGDASMVRHSAAAFSSRAGAGLSSHVCCAQRTPSDCSPALCSRLSIPAASPARRGPRRFTQGHHAEPCAFCTWSVLQERILGATPKVVILSGGPNSVHVEGSPRVPDGFFDWANTNNIPVLGICYGMQVWHPQEFLSRACA